MAKRVARRGRRLDARLRELRIPIPNSRAIVAPVTVAHVLEERWSGIADPQDLYSEPIRHVLELIVEFERFASYDPNDPAANAGWQRISQAHALPHAPDLFNADRLVVARLELGELPAHMVAQLGGWFEVADGLGDTMRAAIELIEWLRDYDNNDLPGLPLLDGALLWPLKLGVHPHFRGRRIGLKLLAHGLWALHRSEGDVAILESAAIQTWFDSAAPEQTAESFEALCRHYTRLGFKRWRTETPPHERDGSLMYTTLGVHGLPVRGLGELTNTAK